MVVLILINQATLSEWLYPNIKSYVFTHQAMKIMQMQSSSQVILVYDNYNLRIIRKIIFWIERGLFI